MSERPSPGRAEAVYQILRDQIVHGRLAPGARIMELELTEALGVSRTPVRAALQRLRQEGYVTAPPGRQQRLVVTPLSEADAAELFEIVGEVEGMAAARTAALPERKRVGLVNRLAQLDRALLEAAAASPPVPDQIFDLFTTFHRELVEAGAGPRLRGLHAMVKPQADRYRRLYSYTQGARIEASVAEHAAILEALRQGDGTGAMQATRLNWRNAATRLAEAIRHSDQLSSW
jgi:DNA-binding GntR family transcriptional regulator